MLLKICIFSKVNWSYIFIQSENLSRSVQFWIFFWLKNGTSNLHTGIFQYLLPSFQFTGNFLLVASRFLVEKIFHKWSHSSTTWSTSSLEWMCSKYIEVRGGEVRFIGDVGEQLVIVDFFTFWIAVFTGLWLNWTNICIPKERSYNFWIHK